MLRPLDPLSRVVGPARSLEACVLPCPLGRLMPPCPPPQTHTPGAAPPTRQGWDAEVQGRGAESAWQRVFAGSVAGGDRYALPYALLKISVALPEGQATPVWLQVGARHAGSHGSGGLGGEDHPWGRSCVAAANVGGECQRWCACAAPARGQVRAGCLFVSITPRPIPAQVLMRSATLVEVEDWSKFVHGCAALMPDTVRAVPYWIDDPLIEMSTEAIRDRIELSIARWKTQSLACRGGGASGGRGSCMMGGLAMRTCPVQRPRGGN